MRTKGTCSTCSFAGLNDLESTVIATGQPHRQEEFQRKIDSETPRVLVSTCYWTIMERILMPMSKSGSRNIPAITCIPPI